MRVAILALQGAFIEHERMLARLGVETFEVRQLRDWEQHKDGLIIPGGESTVQIKLLRDLGLYAPVAEAIKSQPTVSRQWILTCVVMPTAVSSAVSIPKLILRELATMCR